MNRLVRARRLLRALPNNTNEIAEKFQREGIRGSRANGWNCPIATYLFAHIDTRFCVSINGHVALEATGHAFYANQHIVRFIREFDTGKYPFIDVSPFDHQPLAEIMGTRPELISTH